MQPADNDFFEEYKRLDRLCADMYSCQNGVSEYINQMENKSYQGQYRVSSWTSDYKMLKHIRWVRNQIAHDSGISQISEREDLEFVQDFYERIFSGQDPLTLLRKAIETEAERRKQQKTQHTNPAQTYTPPRTYTSDNRKTHGWIGIIIGLGILALILVILFLNN